MSDEKTVMRSIYVPARLDAAVKQMGLERGVTYSSIVAKFIELGIETVKASPTNSVSEKMEAAISRRSFRDKKIAELVAEIDREFDERWEKVKAAVASVYAEDTDD